jgi:hypothetical protein
VVSFLHPLILVANPRERPHSGPRFGKSRKSGLPGGCPWLPGEPGRQAGEIESRRRESMLEMNFRQTSVTRLAQAKDPDSLRESSFDACSLTVLRLITGWPRRSWTGSHLLLRLPSGQVAHSFCQSTTNCSEAKPVPVRACQGSLVQRDRSHSPGWRPVLGRSPSPYRPDALVGREPAAGACDECSQPSPRRPVGQALSQHGEFPSFPTTRA